MITGNETGIKIKDAHFIISKYLSSNKYPAIKPIIASHRKNPYIEVASISSLNFWFSFA